MDSRYKSGLFLAGMLFISVSFLSSCDVCYDCKPKDATEDSPALHVCPRDGEAQADFDVRVSHIRQKGYTCK